MNCRELFSLQSWTLKELRDYTVNELENFKLQVEAIAREKSNVVQGGMEAFVDLESAKLREDLRYMIRQSVRSNRDSTWTGPKRN